MSYDHIVPQTYLKLWVERGHSVHVFDKKMGKHEVTNTEKILGIPDHHTFYPGDYYVPDAVAERFFSCLTEYTVMYDGYALCTPSELNSTFRFFDEWMIQEKNGNTINIKKKKSLKEDILSKTDKGIEDDWAKRIEDDWFKFAGSFRTITLRALKGEYTFTDEILDDLMVYAVVLNTRSELGGAVFHETLDDIIVKSGILEIIDTWDCDQSKKDEALEDVIVRMRHSLMLKCYAEYQQDDAGLLRLIIDKYIEKLGIEVFVSSDSMRFITSDRPCYICDVGEGKKKPVFVITPQIYVELGLLTGDKSISVMKLDNQQTIEKNKRTFDNNGLIVSYGKLDASLYMSN